MANVNNPADAMADVNPGDETGVPKPVAIPEMNPYGVRIPRSPYGGYPYGNGYGHGNGYGYGHGNGYGYGHHNGYGNRYGHRGQYGNRYGYHNG
ncbi:annexin B11-like [Diaphorina citri]|uniref:Annexin B11-like n=1 Tax=Diaphorina citri TaxID=121845 RepID=A0A3Q0J5C2_DIACI|nr:annexin B11-like [Diaphorina citri]